VGRDSASVVLPLSVAAERSGLAEADLISGAVYREGCVYAIQTFTRHLPDRPPELAVVLPRFLVTAPTPPREAYDDKCQSISHLTSS
jgi:hypothetical protein